MPQYPPALLRLLNELRKLPGVGRRGAERMAMHLMQAHERDAAALAEALVELRRRVRHCGRCGNWAEGDLCTICADPHRDDHVLCVVERPPDVWAFEMSEAFRGRYHVLGGALSPLNGVTAEDLTISELETRVEREGTRELILATNASVDGDATAHYLARRLGGRKLRLTRIAQGVPLGGHLDYADAGTLRLALEGRREL